MVETRRRKELISVRKAAGYTQERLAEVLNVDRSTVIRWEAGDYAPLPFLWPKLATVLGQSRDALRDLIDVSVDSGSLSTELEPAFSWLDQHVDWPSGTTRKRVLTTAPAGRPAGSSPGRSQIAAALATYYGDSAPSYARYAARCGPAAIETSVLTRPEWLDLACPLTFEGDRIALTSDGPSLRTPLAEGPAVRRLAEAAAGDVRISDVPIYRLVEVDAQRGSVAGNVELAPFVEYALSVDLLEGELSDNLASGRLARQGSLPMRDRYLPDLERVLDLRARLCAGGVLALTAIARPADPFRGGADYLLLVQERSGHVVNIARKLAVIPKSFHGPFVDHRADARIGATLRRELEEELFGRPDVDRTHGVQRAADPMHPSRLSAPMRWLVDQPGRLRMECTGFGLNLVSGNYEFASLVVVDDEEFWPRFGGDVEANWESAGLRQYSALDGDLIAELVSDESWSNEGLFAFLQGLRRLAEIGGDRVKIPEIELGC